VKIRNTERKVMTDKGKFFAKFKFDQSKIGFVGIEREQFTLDRETQLIIPVVHRYLGHIQSLDSVINQNRFQFGYELSACQLESKIGPCPLNEIGGWLRESDRILELIDNKLGCSRMHIELAPENMPLDIYPDPTGRYQKITKNMSREILLAACRVAGTHIHVGMLNMKTAISVYNKVIAHADELIKMGDLSLGKRMELYRVMAPRYYPKPIASADELYQQACAFGFVDDPRKCWTLTRISVHGTIEFRMFDATKSIDQIVEWASHCHKLCF